MMVLNSNMCNQLLVNSQWEDSKDNLSLDNQLNQCTLDNNSNNSPLSASHHNMDSHRHNLASNNPVSSVNNLKWVLQELTDSQAEA